MRGAGGLFGSVGERLLGRRATARDPSGCVVERGCRGAGGFAASLRASNRQTPEPADTLGLMLSGIVESFTESVCGKTMWRCSLLSHEPKAGSRDGATIR